MDRPLAQTLPLIREAGGQAVELSWLRVRTDDSDPHGRVSSVRRLLHANGLGLSGLSVTDLAAVEKKGWDPAVTLIREQMAHAKSLGVSSVNLCAGDRREQSLEMLACGLEQVLSVAFELGLAVNLANRCGTRVEQIEDLRWVFAAAGQPALRGLNHVGHFYAAAVNPRDVLAEFEHQTACLHLSDRVGKRPVPIGQGKVNLPGLMADLKQMNYRGWLVVDLEVSDTPDATQALTDALTYIEQLLETADENE